MSTTAGSCSLRVLDGSGQLLPGRVFRMNTSAVHVLDALQEGVHAGAYTAAYLLDQKGFMVTPESGRLSGDLRWKPFPTIATEEQGE